jgi:hypothetical protein
MLLAATLTVLADAVIGEILANTLWNMPSCHSR